MLPSPSRMASEMGPLPDVGAIHSLKECDIVVYARLSLTEVSIIPYAEPSRSMAKMFMRQSVPPNSRTFQYYQRHKNYVSIILRNRLVRTSSQHNTKLAHYAIL